MVKRTILLSGLFVFFYTIFIGFYSNKGVGTHQWQENQIRAQRFLYERVSDTVLVGTSLSARILLDTVNTVSSCAFSACVVEDGLRLVLSKEVLPRYILLETNYMLRPSNGEIVNSNTHGPLPFLRKFIPFLREQNSPISIIGNCFMKNALAPVALVDINRLEKSIDSRISEDYTHYLSSSQMEERIYAITSLIRQVESRGSKIILFEMPVNVRLKYVPSNNQTRQAVQRMFPKEKYIYLPNDTCEYLTTDGEHLDADGQRRYSHFLKEVLESTQF